MKRREQPGEARYEQIAEALILIAKSNHYMVGLKERVTSHELEAAKHILINLQNATPEGTLSWYIYDLALDISEKVIWEDIIEL